MHLLTGAFVGDVAEGTFDSGSLKVEKVEQQK